MGQKAREKREKGHAGAPMPAPASRPALLPQRDAAIVAAVALVFRAFYAWLYHDSPFFHVPVVDASTFHLWAEAIRQHREFLPGVYFKPPLYPHVLAAMYNLFGPRPEPMYVLQVLLGAGTCVLVLGLGRRVFSPRVGLLGALICALLPVLPFLEFQLVAEPLTTFLTTAALLILVARRAAARARRRRGPAARHRGARTTQPADPGARVRLVGVAAARSRARPGRRAAGGDRRRHLAGDAAQPGRGQARAR